MPLAIQLTVLALAALFAGTALTLYLVLLPEKRSEIDRLETQLEARDERIARLEGQLDEYESLRLGIGPPVDEFEQEEEFELPDEVETWIEAGFDDPEIKREYKAFARAEIEREPALETQPNDLLEAMRG